MIRRHKHIIEPVVIDVVERGAMRPSFQRLDIISVFDALAKVGHDEDFSPRKTPHPTGAKKGTIERIQVMRQRIQNGEELFHPNDEPTCSNHDEYCLCVTFCQEEQIRMREEKAKIRIARDGYDKLKHKDQPKRKKRNFTTERLAKNRDNRG